MFWHYGKQFTQRWASALSENPHVVILIGYALWASFRSIGAQKLAQVSWKRWVMIIRWLGVLGVVFGLSSAGAQASSGGGNALAEGVNYIAVTPPLVVNFGGPGKVRFIKAELSLRAENAADATEVMHHLPLIRDRLVSILSAQTEEVVNTAEGKEYLRVYALSEINKALLEVEGHHAGVAAAGADDKVEKKDAAEPADPAANLPSAADVKPVKGPASDLFFNNFVVQK